MQLDDIIHRLLPTVGPLAFLVAVSLHLLSNRSALLWVSALSLLVTLVASITSAWLGLGFDGSHDLPEWHGQFYWWATQWVAPAGYAVAGVSFLAFYQRKQDRRGA